MRHIRWHTLGFCIKSACAFKWQTDLDVNALEVFKLPSFRALTSWPCHRIIDRSLAFFSFRVLRNK